MAVYTEIDDVALRAFVDQYDIGAVLSCKGIAEGVENSNFMLVTDRGPYILTLYEKRVHERDLPFFLGLMEHLAARGLPCPTPIAGRDGKALRRTAKRPAAIVSFLKGVWPRRPEPKHCAELGRAMARMHLAVADFPRQRANNLSLAGWQGLFESCRERADEVQAGLAKTLERELEHLAQHWPQAGGGVPQGVIHADLFPDNVFFLDDKLSGIIDFYFACNDAFAYDLAISLNAWCFEPDGAFNITKARALVQAYGTLRPLNAEEFRLLPLFARGAALRFLLTRLYDWLNQVPGAMVKPKDPREYLKKLNFHRRIKDASSYGLDKAP